MDKHEAFEPMRRGLLEFAVLAIISRAAAYSADILAALSTTEFATQEGTLYPLLGKLRREGLLDYTWQESETGPPRKYYSLTPQGRARLAELKAYWGSITQTIKKLGA